AFLFEYLDRTISRPEDVERHVRLPTLGIVPDFAIAGKTSAPSLADAIGENALETGAEPHSDASVVPAQRSPSLVWESYRSLQASILLCHAEEPPKIVLFTSGKSGEGKTVTAINTAIVFAQMEARVLVIDADLRRSSYHDYLFHERASRITELLTG